MSTIRKRLCQCVLWGQIAGLSACSSDEFTSGDATATSAAGSAGTGSEEHGGAAGESGLESGEISDAANTTSGGGSFGADASEADSIGAESTGAAGGSEALDGLGSGNLGGDSSVSTDTSVAAGGAPESFGGSTSEAAISGSGGTQANVTPCRFDDCTFDSGQVFAE